MSYNVNKKVRLKDVKRTVSKLKEITDSHEERLSGLEALAEALLKMTNAVIRNLTKEE